MENKFYITTYWQSLDLLQAGLDRDTADFVYERNYEMVAVEDEDGEIAYYAPILTDGYHPRLRRDIDVFCTDLVPAWSIGRLLEIMADLELDYEYSTIEPIDSIINSMINAIIAKKRQINALNILDI